MLEHYVRGVSHCKHAGRDMRRSENRHVCRLTPTKAVTHQEDKVYLVIKMQSLLLCPLEWQWQRTHPGAWGREVPPALPHHLRHHCLPSLSLVFIRASAPPPQQPWSSWARVRQRFIRINVALQRRVSVWRVPGCQEKESPALLCHIE